MSLTLNFLLTFLDDLLSEKCIDTLRETHSMQVREIELRMVFSTRFRLSRPAKLVRTRISLVIRNLKFVLVLFYSNNWNCK